MTVPSRRSTAQSTATLTLHLPPGLSGLGADVEALPMGGSCIVISANDDSPLRVGDVIETLNGRALADVDGGLSAWLDVVAGNEGRDNNRGATVVVRRQVVGSAAAPATAPAAGRRPSGDAAGLPRGSGLGRADLLAMRSSFGRNSLDRGDEGVARAARAVSPPSQRYQRKNPRVIVAPSSPHETAAERWLRERSLAMERRRKEEEVWRLAEAEAARRLERERLADLEQNERRTRGS
eukprot:CAMPEP_0172565164 /NCGR_PEP_ID=MMETSP1067-20121228/107197_1 /TAXON_ID=265564 ORGANISM="Thalassiosira punctigera, Strain Tpunct2005C2" /NCGR_SAMPLE_ID=MMETSP1067 /ASSEMBLY_ACC=CAM_ASM_000444 /LENGTH=236 /DNA_ID=CAMNT_0013355989 /DNA_START=43 /DNA_END=750 /DNA_ORIENTATION=+